MANHNLFIDNDFIRFLKKVNINISNKDLENDEYIDKSGLRLLNEFIKKKLGQISFFLEYSVYVSSLLTNKIFDYAVFNEAEQNIFNWNNVNSITNIYSEIINSNNDYDINNRIGFYLQRDFFRATNDYRYYVSDLSLNELSLINEEWAKKIIKKFNNQSKSPKSKNSLNSRSCTEYRSMTFEKNFDYYIEKFAEGCNIDDTNKKFHKLWGYFFIGSRNKNYRSKLISIPILYAGLNIDEHGKYFEGQGAIFLILVYKTEDEERIKPLLGNIVIELSYIVKDIFANYLLFSGMELYNKSRKESIKSAVAAIMSRNMSHNIGSHVLSRLSNTISNQTEINEFLKKKEINNLATLKNHNDLPNILKGKEGKYLGNILKEIEDNEETYKIVREYLLKKGNYIIYRNYDCEKADAEFFSIGHFFKYLQHRQDYIATVTGSGKDIPIYQNFKNDIIDELLISEKRKRHANGAMKNLLLENIVKSEHIRGEMIKVYFNNWDPNDKDALDKNIAQNLNIALPAGNLGAHAFFSIFENFIRNSAKHSGKEWSEEDKLVIKIETPDIIWDNAEKMIINDHFAGKVFWVEQKNTKNPIKKGPYYIIKDKENNERYIFYAEIPYKLNFGMAEDSISFDLSDIKDFKNLNNIEFKMDDLKIKKGGITLKLIREEEDHFTLIITDKNDKKMRSYPIHIIKNHENKRKACIFITNKFELEKKEDNSWETKNIEIQKSHETERWSADKTIKLQEKICINDYFELKFDERFYNPDDYIRFTLSDNLSNYNIFHHKIEKGLKENLIDNTGRLLESKKGLKEMWISACWIRGEEVIKEKKFKPPILSCVCNITQSNCFDCHLNNNHGSLQYVFFIKKAKEVLFVLDDKIEKEDVLKKITEEKNKSYGIEFKSLDEYSKTENIHKYLVFVFVNDHNLNPKMKEQFEKYENNRAISINLSDFTEFPDKAPQEIKAEVLKRWIKKNWNNNQDEIWILDDEITKDSIMEINQLDGICVKHPGGKHEEEAGGKKIFVWKKHLESPDEFDIMPEYIKKAEYIESITGNNKTSWLIRDYKPKDAFWRLSLLEAAKCKILIIDERIWEEQSNLKEIDIERLKNANQNTKLLLNKKNIEIWNLIIKKINDIEDRKVDIKEISFVDLVGNVNKLNQLDELLKGYDIISIHQGIIDKIINNSEKELKDLELKFNNSKAKIITHSGRSRPDSEDMLYREKGNFISFTSLDSALKDSKYHLVNLLYSVKGE